VISSTAIFASSDIEATISYYKNVLGFESSWTWGEPPNFGGASMGGVSLMFCLQPDLAKNVRGHQHWIKVDDADELFQKHKENGAKVVQELENKPWGVREYVVEDLNGYYLRFGGPPVEEVRNSKAFPEGVTISRRKPTNEEFAAVAGTVFDHKEPQSDFMDRTWGGVVAHAPDGEPIGVLRIMCDAPGWFSIWDVAVLPEWQAQRIGSKLMEEAVAMVRETSPGAIVFLFTFKHAFYERLGFSQESVSMRRL
jgi:uncharacterized glyoxalase superfamily protein PhnB/GNAT superfamily N-acetyltransferase